jgi:hypothetical protein
MQRDKQHVPVTVEDLLGAVAVMVVDVDDGDGAVRRQPLCHQGGVIQVTVAAEAIARRVMSGWPAQGIGRRRSGCTPGARGDRRRVGPVVADGNGGSGWRPSAGVAEEAGHQVPVTAGGGPR